MTTATQRWAALLLLALAAPTALAQNDALGDEFIFFVDGTNVLVPSVEGGTTVTDPLQAGNKVARFSSGAWAESGFAWSRTGGVDASGNVGAAYGESDTLYFRILSDPNNAGATVSIMLNDITNDSGIPRPDAEAGGDADYLMRLIWPVPAELHDGAWHDVAIPLPPATFAALQTARDNNELMDTIDGVTVAAGSATNSGWRYTGAWSTGGFGIGEVGGFTPGTDDPLWEEFQWDQLYRIGPFWDSSGDIAKGPIYLDDVYIGGPNTSTDGATDPPSAMSGVTFAAAGSTNMVSWSELPDAAGYNVYTSLDPITDVSADGVVLLERVGLGGDTEVVHRYESPHPSLSNQTIYYAVTSLSQFGVENPDVSSSGGNVSNPNIAQRPFIRELTEEQANTLFDLVANGTISDDPYAENHPVFVFDSSHSTRTEGATTPTDEDNSALIKIGYTDLEEWFVYGEVTDDIVVFAPEFTGGGDTYLYDSIELEIGHYDVRDAGGDALTGSPHTSMNRGEEPDYQIRIAGLANTNGDIVGAGTWIGFSLNENFPNASIVERTATGWRFLSLIPMDAIQNTAEGDVLLSVPASDELQLIPFSMSLNDADATGQRENQIVYSVKPNVTNQWYQTPAQWEVVAIAGNGVQGTTAVEDGTENDGFSLAQSTPNPAAGATDVTFTLGAPAHATVEVFNMLGQRVLTVIDRELGIGEHTVTVDTGDLAAGVYVYRLSAGNYAAARRMTVIR